MKRGLWSAVLFLMVCNVMALPKEFRVKAGKLEVEFIARSFWNLNDICYDGDQYCRRSTAWYGTATAQDVKGWVGSGHMENGIGEKEVSIVCTVDGKPWTPVAGTVTAQKFMLRKKSLIRHLQAEYIVKLENDRLYETITLTPLKNLRVPVIYHFMHPWMNKFVYWRFGDRSGKITGGQYSDKEQSMVRKDNPKWYAAYAPENRMAYVSVLESPECFHNQEKYLVWNRISDRKLYYQLYSSNLSQGKALQWKMVTYFKRLNKDQWNQLKAE